MRVSTFASLLAFSSFTWAAPALEADMTPRGADAIGNPLEARSCNIAVYSGFHCGAKGGTLVGSGGKNQCIHAPGARSMMASPGCGLVAAWAHARNNCAANQGHPVASTEAGGCWPIGEPKHVQRVLVQSI